MQACLSLSTSQLEQVWRYDIETDFHPLSDPTRPFETISLPWASRDRHIRLARQPRTAEGVIQHAFSSDELKLALAVGDEIDVYDLDSGRRITLSGHTVDIACVAFAPGRPDTLVSSANEWDDESNSERAEVVIWDLGEAFATSTAGQPSRATDITLGLLERIRADLSKLEPTITLERDDEDDLTTTLDRLLGRIILRSSARKIKGRLCSSNACRLFNHTGNTLVVLPGTTPATNDDDQWDIDLYNLDTDETITLSGHRDMIVWIAFSADDRILVSASWDGTFRAWHPGTGECLHVWRTDTQNVTGAISPTSPLCLGVDNGGTIRAWDLHSGDEIWSYDVDQVYVKCLDYSADGRYLLAGCRDLGQLMLFDTSRPIVDGKLLPIQTRVLSLDKTTLHPDLKRLAADFLSVRSLRCVRGPPGDIAFVSSIDIDEGIEIVSLAQGKRWRIVPVGDGAYDGIPQGPSTKTEPYLTPVWSILQDSAQIAVIESCAVWIWNLRATEWSSRASCNLFPDDEM